MGRKNLWCWMLGHSYACIQPCSHFMHKCRRCHKERYVVMKKSRLRNSGLYMVRNRFDLLLLLELLAVLAIVIRFGVLNH